MTPLQRSAAVTSLALVAAAFVNWVGTDVATDDAVAAFSRGAKKALVASLVRYFPLHFSSSVKGASNNNFKRFSSLKAAVDTPLFLL